MRSNHSLSLEGKNELGPCKILRSDIISSIEVQFWKSIDSSVRPPPERALMYRAESSNPPRLDPEERESNADSSPSPTIKARIPPPERAIWISIGSSSRLLLQGKFSKSSRFNASRKVTRFWLAFLYRGPV
ncbi:hypothetical protein OGAPHI_001856 [Ogataea philodendri]|uniref:Uncharacterized protein n=1 Tax=Ogataea philodendri TaxID=1378263 RepID=A0A9P8P9X6_9ASCO|nr:uncharacterized protein OGAPHI_001856 [Ogataea philodendri]KAH3668102.1 hypothetical protein OGAPHI_001856 [Ogataea philodendri]